MNDALIFFITDRDEHLATKKENNTTNLYEKPDVYGRKGNERPTRGLRDGVFQPRLVVIVIVAIDGHHIDVQNSFVRGLSYSISTGQHNYPYLGHRDDKKNDGIGIMTSFQTSLDGHVVVLDKYSYLIAIFNMKLLTISSCKQKKKHIWVLLGITAKCAQMRSNYESVSKTKMNPLRSERSFTH